MASGIAKDVQVRVQMDMDNLRRRLDSAVKGSLLRAGLVVELEAKKSMRRGAVRGKGKDRWMESSLPGDPPHVRTGTLRSSITTALRRAGREVIIGPTRIAHYGEYLEFGTSKMAARPFMGPALEKARPKIPAQFKGSLRRG